MPYPFMQFPTFGEVRKHLKENYQCHYVDDGDDAYFLRQLSEGSKMVYCEIIVAGEDDRLHTEHIRHICSRLHIIRSHSRLNTVLTDHPKGQA